MNIAEYKIKIAIERKQKDQFFKMSSQSPIPHVGREEFTALDYYQPDLTYRFELELNENNKKEILKIEDTRGSLRKFLRWGNFQFKIKDKGCKLHAYKSSPEEEMLFIPFRDATSGKETYGAGRYLELEPERDYTPDGKWILDFNKAYNPWCAYSKDYACPFVPPENWLKVPIYAGEKDYKK
jgi:uncharacterized protein (DUF1684 family)